jgi:alpha-tubulin suppressor-like RCC1 family protein
VQTSGLSTASALYAVGGGVGATDTCATRSNGTLWCFGDNLGTVTGTGSSLISTLTPTQVVNAHDHTAITAVTALTVDLGAVCVVSNGEHLTCWGSGENGELPSGPSSDVLPYRV